MCWFWIMVAISIGALTLDIWPAGRELGVISVAGAAGRKTARRLRDFQRVGAVEHGDSVDRARQTVSAVGADRGAVVRGNRAAAGAEHRKAGIVDQFLIRIEREVAGAGKARAAGRLDLEASLSFDRRGQVDCWSCKSKPPEKS